MVFSVCDDGVWSGVSVALGGGLERSVPVALWSRCSCPVALGPGVWGGLWGSARVGAASGGHPGQIPTGVGGSFPMGSECATLPGGTQ